MLKIIEKCVLAFKVLALQEVYFASLYWYGCYSSM